jgi:hypothetical protein
MLPEPQPDAAPSRLPRGARPIGLGLILLCLSGTFVAGALSKGPCASGAWDGQQYRVLCYTDIVPLLGTEQLSGGRLPFLEPCVQTGANCDEYPVLTMYVMRMAGWVSDTDYRTYFAANVALLWLAAIATGIALYAVVGNRALYFALAPTLLVYGVVNWDLVAVALATAAVPAFFLRRDVLAGVLLGLGASSKFYPAMLVVPFIAQRLQDREPDRAIRLGWAAAGSYLAVNLPFFIASPSSWLTFLRFNAERCPDFDSLWSIGWRIWNGLHDRPGGSCPETVTLNVASIVVVAVLFAGVWLLWARWARAIPRWTLIIPLVILFLITNTTYSPVSWLRHVPVNVVSGVAFVGLFAGVWFLKARRSPDFPRWTLILPLVVTFLLTNKVYSPQYGLWLLPLFALALPRLWTFVAFSIADVAVFCTRFWWFGEYSDVGLPDPVAGALRGLGMTDPTVDQRAFEAAVLLRAAVLIWCLIAWVRREPEVLPVETATERLEAAA